MLLLRAQECLVEELPFRSEMNVEAPSDDFYVGFFSYSFQ